MALCIDDEYEQRSNLDSDVSQDSEGSSEEEWEEEEWEERKYPVHECVPSVEEWPQGNGGGGGVVIVLGGSTEIKDARKALQQAWRDQGVHRTEWPKIIVYHAVLARQFPMLEGKYCLLITEALYRNQRLWWLFDPDYCGVVVDDCEVHRVPCEKIDGLGHCMIQKTYTISKRMLEERRGWTEDAGLEFIPTLNESEQLRLNDTDHAGINFVWTADKMREKVAHRFLGLELPQVRLDDKVMQVSERTDTLDLNLLPIAQLLEMSLCDSHQDSDSSAHSCDFGGCATWLVEHELRYSLLLLVCANQVVVAQDLNDKFSCPNDLIFDASKKDLEYRVERNVLLLAYLTNHSEYTAEIGLVLEIFGCRNVRSGELDRCWPDMVQDSDYASEIKEEICGFIEDCVALINDMARDVRRRVQKLFKGKMHELSFLSCCSSFDGVCERLRGGARRTASMHEQAASLSKFLSDCVVSAAKASTSDNSSGWRLEVKVAETNFQDSVKLAIEKRNINLQEYPALKKLVELQNSYQSKVCGCRIEDRGELCRILCDMQFFEYKTQEDWQNYNRRMKEIKRDFEFFENHPFRLLDRRIHDRTHMREWRENLENRRKLVERVLFHVPESSSEKLLVRLPQREHWALQCFSSKENVIGDLYCLRRRVVDADPFRVTIPTGLLRPRKVDGTGSQD